MFEYFKKKWLSPGGYGEILKVAIPLILSTSVHTIQTFVDRMFLAWYDLDMMPAAMQAGVTSFSFAALFLGTAGYVSTFIAQYNGSKQLDKIGSAVWQGIYFSLISGFICFLLIFIAQPLFDWMGHDPAIRVHEITYFKIMSIGILPLMLSAAISSFYTGRGKTWTVLVVTTANTILNIILDYVLIFGHFGFPQMGIRGAAIATVISGCFALVLYCLLFFRASNERLYRCFSGYRFDKALFGRLMKFGFPHGIQFMLDIMAFTAFVAFIGRIDRISQIATNMAFSINMLAFLPMIGMGMAVSVIVGNRLGADEPKIARRGAWSAFYLCTFYMTVVAAGYYLFPNIFISPFEPKTGLQDFEIVRKITSDLLIFVAIYCLFDTGNIIFAAALRGAGDTRFVMFTSMTMHWLLLVLPTYYIIEYNLGLYAAWLCITIFVLLLAIVFWARFMGGKWESMRVIERPATTVPLNMPEVPTAESDHI